MVFAPSKSNKILEKFDIVRIDMPPIISMVNPNHELVKLASVMDWAAFDEKFGGFFACEKGRPPVKTRIVVAALYLKHTYNLSDEEVIARIQENLYWQYFCGLEFFSHSQVCDATSLVRWRKRMGESGMEFLLQKTLECALKIKAIKVQDLDDVIVDTTVQEKNISFPTDAKLLNRAREAVVKVAEDSGVELRQNYNRTAKELVAKYSRYSHAKQFKRARRCRKKLQTYLGRVLRDVSRKIDETKLSESAKTRLRIARKISDQMRTGKDKVYSFHAPEVECISKGKAHKRYEFGCKVSIATTNRSNWIVGAKALHGRPYDGHTLIPARTQVKDLTGKYPSRAYLDKGYKGTKPPDPTQTRVYLSGQKRGVKGFIKKRLRRRSAVEPVIGHMKRGHRLGRNFLKGIQGDQINVILAAAGNNTSKLLAALFIQNLLAAFLSNFIA